MKRYPTNNPVEEFNRNVTITNLKLNHLEYRNVEGKVTAFFKYNLELVWKSERVSRFDWAIQKTKDYTIWKKKYVSTSPGMLWYLKKFIIGMDDYGDIFYGINFASADYLGLCTNE